VGVYLRVLLIEDSENDAILVTRELKRGDYDVTWERVETPEEMEKALAKDWDIILSDYHMPHFSGLTALALLRQKPLDIPFILISGTIGESIAVAAMKAGAHDYIMKDNISRLVPAVQRELREAEIRHSHHLAQEELRDSEEKYRNLVENIPSITYTSQMDREDSVIYISPQLQKFLSLSAAEWMTNDLWSKRLHLDDRKWVQEEYKNAYRNEKSFCAEYRLLTSDNREVWAHDECAPIRSKDGLILFMQGYMVDITKRKQAEIALQESNRRLEKALEELEKMQKKLIREERINALGQMAAGIAHDFNNALSPICGFSELLLASPQSLENKEKVTRYLELIHTAAEDAAGTVRRLREFYRVREAKEEFSSLDLNEVIRYVVSLTQPKWQNQAQERGVMIDVETQLPAIPAVIGHESSLREALLNLIFNAVDAIVQKVVQEKTQRPHLATTSNESQTERIILSTHCDDEKSIILEISDTGTGMSDEVRNRCFEPFFSTKGEKGSGLGLAMVYGIVKRHEGTIDLETELGKGTTFHLVFPIGKHEEKAEAKQPGSDASHPLRILLAEDDDIVRQVLTEYLRVDLHIVTTASNGKEGWEKFCTGHFDLVVTDRAMPQMGGDEMSVLIKKENSKVPIILVSGFGDIIKSTDEQIPSVDIVLSKPVSMADLRQAVAKCSR
jgi:PAS domain S-box-containing protein